VLGPVYRALDPGADRQVGIKLFRLDATPEQAVALAARLTALVSQLPSCPSIAAPLAAGVEGASAYLALDYVAADSIDARLRRRTPPSLEQAVPILQQVAEALEAAAAAGIYHGALHPRDVLVSTRGAVTVTGLGVVQALEAAGLRPPFRRPYAAPERVGGRPWDSRADVFSLAVLALELATGRRPLLPESGSARHWAGLDAERAEAVREVFARGLTEHPEERAASARGWVASLGAALGLAAQPEAPPARQGPETAAVVRLPPEPSGTGPDPAPPAGGTSSGDPGAGATPPAGRWPEADGAAAERGASRRVGDTAPAAAADAPASGALAGDTAAAAATLVDPGTGPVGHPAGRGEAVDGTAPAGTVTSAFLARSPDTVGPGVRASDHGATGGGRAALPLAPDEGPSEPGLDVLDGAEPAGFGGPGGPLAAERPSAAWRLPAAVALVIGVLAGFLAGYAVGVRRPASGAAPQAGASGALGTEERVMPVPDDRPAGGTASAAVPAPETVAPALGAPPRDRARPAVGPRPGEPPVDAARVDGRLLVRASPAGAAVEVNGRTVGAAPLALGGLAPGPYRVRVSAPGYEPVERRVELTRLAPTAALAVTLKRAGAAPAREAAEPPGPPAALASIEVVSRPPRARVFLDGRAIGLTPLRVSALEPRMYSVRLELAGHRDWTLDVQAVAGRVVRVTASLEPQTLP
jgi:serine/threonine-protein kinase